jgi:hypothetical protein
VRGNALGSVGGEHDRGAVVGARARTGEEQMGLGVVEPLGRSFEQQHRRVARLREQCRRLLGPVGEPARIGARRASATAAFTAVDQHPARVDEHVTGKEVKQRAGARSLGATQGQELAPVRGERYPLHERPPAPAHRHVLGFEGGSGHEILRRSGCRRE